MTLKKTAMIVRISGGACAAGAVAVAQYFPNAHWSVKVVGWLGVVAFILADVAKTLKEESSSEDQGSKS